MSIKKLAKATLLILGSSFAMMGCNDYIDIDVTNYPDYWEDPNYASSIAIGPVENDVWDSKAYTFFEPYLVEEFYNSSMTIYDRSREYLKYSLSEALEAERQQPNPADLYLTSSVTEFIVNSELIIVQEEIETYLVDDWGDYIYDEYGDPLVSYDIIEYERYEHTGTAELTYSVYDVDTSTLVTTKSVRRSWTDPDLTVFASDANLNYILEHAADEVIYDVANQNLPYAINISIDKDSTLRVSTSYEQRNKDGLMCNHYPGDTKIKSGEEPTVYLSVRLPEKADNNRFQVDIIQETGEKEIDQSLSAPTLFSESILWKHEACGIMAVSTSTKDLYSKAKIDDGKAKLIARLWSGSTLMRSIKFQIEK